MDLKVEYAGKFVHKACHCSNSYLWDDKSKNLGKMCGGWHDAGDYGRYITAGSVAVAHLLYAYLLHPDAFVKQRINIPESDGIMPDILWECKYEIDWMLNLQREDGAVYHKLTTAMHAAFVMPEEDINPLYVLPVSSMATADFAAVCSLASKVYSKYDPQYAELLKNKAMLSATWLKNNTDFIPFKNPEGCRTGEYGEWSDIDNRFWAYTEIASLTKDKEWAELAYKIEAENKLNLTSLGYGNVAGLGALCILLDKGNIFEKSIVDKSRTAYLQESLRLKEVCQKSGYGCAMEEQSYGWGSNGTLMQKGMILAIADYLNENIDNNEYIRSQADVLVGKNPLGFSYISGVGYNSMKNPHLRPAWADGIEECIPGMVSGGPNRNLQDEGARRYIKAGTKPMRCYIDKMECYSLNEITIYWNSPAVFVWAYLVTNER